MPDPETTLRPTPDGMMPVKRAKAKPPERPANDEMIEGFRDGYDLSAPEPSANRSQSYRHGFMCGRMDKGKIKPRLAADLRRGADLAMLRDDHA